MGDAFLINGWFNRESQEIRFAALLNSVRYCGGRIADYGCGTGDLFGYLKTTFRRPFIGVMISIARCRDCAISVWL